MTKVFFVFSTFVSLAFSAVNPILSNYWVDSQSIATVAEKFEIHRRVPGGFEVYVPANRVRELFALSQKAQLLQFDIRNEFFDGRTLEGYHSFKEVQALLKKSAETHPEIAKLVDYGTSMQGNPLKALLIGKVGKRKPEILITAATHGDELITVEVVLGIIDQILNQYTPDARIRELVDNHDIYFIPVVNPDGFSSQDRYDNGRDPNRSYPWPENTSNEPSGSIGPLIKFFHAHEFVATIDYHASGELIMYPWAYTDTSPAAADETQFRLVGDLMARHNNYEVGQISQIIYIAKGSSADYYYWKQHSISYGIEMAQTKVPEASEIGTILKDNLDSTLDFIGHF